MRSPSRVRTFLWLSVLLGCAALVITTVRIRWARIDHMNGMAQWSVPPSRVDAQSPTGYADGRRVGLSPGRSEEAFPWILQTQALVTGGPWRPERVDYDNAPLGRELHDPWLYRLWLALVARVDHLVSGQSLALAAERATRWADPALQLLFLGSVGVWIGRRFGGRAAALAGILWVAGFPLATDFLPGAPSPRGLAWVCLATGLLAIVAATSALTDAGRRRAFAVGGIAAGVGLSLDFLPQFLAIVGVSLGAITTLALMGRRSATPTDPMDPRGWRWWALCGALTSLAVLALGHLPEAPVWRAGRLHPGHAIAWIGWGELLVLLHCWIQTRQAPWRTGCGIVASAAALVLLAGLPVSLYFSDTTLVAPAEALDGRLSPLTDLVASSLSQAFSQEGALRLFIATLLPWLTALVGIGLWWARVRRGQNATPGGAALGAAILLLLLASLELRAFAPAGVGLLVLAVALVARDDRVEPRAFDFAGLPLLAGAAAAFPGFLLQWPATGEAGRTALGRGDVEAIVERDLAFWLARQAAGKPAIVLASPAVSAALTYHGGLHGVASLHPDNAEGLRAALRIARATSPDEALALLRQREIRYLVLPSWDPFFDASARVGTPAGAASFVGALRRWVPLTWIRPLPYRLPKIGGFEQESVVVLEVIEDQDEARTLSLQAEYFLDMGWIDLASGLRRELQRFPADLGARTALARVEAARNDGEAFAASFNALLPLLSAGADRSLAWDRRVSLAALLAQGQRPDLAEIQLRRTIKDASESRLRALSTGALFRWLALARRFGVELPDPSLRQLAPDLLPPDLAARLKP